MKTKTCKEQTSAKKRRDLLMRAWISSAVALGMKFCDVWSPDKKTVPAVLFATSEAAARRYVKSYGGVFPK